MVMRLLRTAFITLITTTLAVTISTQLLNRTTAGEITSAAGRPLVKVIMTVDWEGIDLRANNLQAMKNFRYQFPSIPILHYLNAAYFTKPDAVANKVSTDIKSVLLPIDQLGMHIHGWKTLFEAAGVKHRRVPNWDPGNVIITDNDCRYDCGFNVPISAYTTEELRKVIAYSRKILNENGLGYAHHFRAGGWMMSGALANALSSEGFYTDSSAVPVKFLAADLREYHILNWLQALWKDTHPYSSPYPLLTQFQTSSPYPSSLTSPLLAESTVTDSTVANSPPANSPLVDRTLYEIPDNAALADYVVAEQMLEVIKGNLNLAKQSGKPKIVVLGFHEESAEEYLPQIIRMIIGVNELNKETARKGWGKDLVILSTMPESGRPGLSHGSATI